ncbi:GNAT family N-acetyltransferase [Amycolatopsis sp. K13G38]|uniref:GNAT family N-acetyltransferase n=1 Tax=Amycolatopsis acididurans TaxID=2724524 RepID=A0ABX1JA93_9PSEU|nr:GNAT family N-acetyltransferase [Amycolatopsis acididurans]NKQ56697.1 GNAT family N-acetyltransferase [Amycolatopsis acididurans]
MLRSPRLDLVELCPETLARIADRDRAWVEAKLGVEVPEPWLDVVPAEVNHKLVREDPAVAPWLSRGIVLREECRLVGEIGFHSRPDSLAVVEIGYEVLPEYQRRGIAREAAYALTDWAHATTEATVVYATIARTNRASIALVRSLGFRYDETYIDPVEGPLVFYESKLPLAR